MLCERIQFSVLNFGLFPGFLPAYSLSLLHLELLYLHPLPLHITLRVWERKQDKL